ncbi:P-loop containing nucleoside triphosphate hydrolase protein, partial [Sphaerosporella brunnea]
MTSGSSRKSKLLVDLIWIAAANVSAYYLIRWLISYRDPEREKKEAVKKKSDAILRRLEANGGGGGGGGGASAGSSGEKKKEKLVLNSYEQTILTEVVAPEDIHVSFDDIGGLDPIIEELKESVIYPLTLPDLFSSTSTLLSAPKGVLLYGPPGCGKTMLARALARESGACFINLHISTLTEKWYGDSNKLVTAVFSLAKKLQPTIVFIDEIDAVLRSRSSTDHEASTMVKAEFMTHWDGLLSTNSSGAPAQIMILGATNRIQDIDEAILRRMPKKFSINLPDASQRRRILGLILKDTKLSPAFDVDELVSKTAGMSGSDLTEACRDAAMVPVREYIKKFSQGRKVTDAGLAGINRDDVRGVENTDFFRKNAGGRRPVEEELEAFGK